jgi:hypothetical protein
MNGVQRPLPLVGVQGAKPPDGFQGEALTFLRSICYRQHGAGAMTEADSHAICDWIEPEAKTKQHGVPVL